MDISNGIIVVGAPNDGSDSASGEVFVFERLLGNGYWHQVNQFTASDTAINDTFGKSVSIYHNHIIVGAPSANNDAGNVYFFELGAQRLLSNVTAPIFAAPSDLISIDFDIYLSDVSDSAHVTLWINSSDVFESDFRPGTNSFTVTMPDIIFTPFFSDYWCQLMAVDKNDANNSDEVDFTIKFILGGFPIQPTPDIFLNSLIDMMSQILKATTGLQPSTDPSVITQSLASQNIPYFNEDFTLGSTRQNLDALINNTINLQLNSGIRSYNDVPNFIPINNYSDTQTNFELSDLIMSCGIPSISGTTVSGSFNLIALGSDTHAQIAFMLNGKIVYQSDFGMGSNSFRFNTSYYSGYSVYIVGAVKNNGDYISNRRSGLLYSSPLDSFSPQVLNLEAHFTSSDNNTVNITVVETDFFGNSDNSDVVTVVCTQYSSDSSDIFVFAFSDTIPVPGGFTVASTIDEPGKYKLTATSANTNSQTIFYINKAGTKTNQKVTWNLLGSFLSIIFDLPASFITAFPGVSDLKSVLSDRIVK